jgi:hypothetical protein
MPPSGMDYDIEQPKARTISIVSKKRSDIKALGLENEKHCS